ncbi:MAG: XrtV sorting system accessory protein [Phenylobacterium sp.]
MDTVYDWMTIAVFGGLVVLFLHRSMQEGEPKDTIWHYMPPSLGCMAANYVGKDLHQGPLSAAIVVAVLAYVVLVLKPFGLKF